MDGVYGYKFDCRKMFLWNPAYFERVLKVYGHGRSSSLAPDHWTSTVILKEDLANAWPARPDWNFYA